MYVSDSLRQLAKSEKVAVIALSQLARPKSIHDVPTMTQLKESGDIEAHAHLVALLHLQVNDQGEPTGEDLIVIAKQRMGRQGSIAVTYNRDFLNVREAGRTNTSAIGANAGRWYQEGAVRRRKPRPAPRPAFVPCSRCLGGCS